MTAVDTLAENRQAVLLRLLRREQAKMTVQLPLVGPDGLIVGSDTKTLEPVRGETSDFVPEYQFASDSKFLFNANQTLVCAVAGTYEALILGRRILEQVGSQQPLTGLTSHQTWRRHLEAIADTVVMPEKSGAEIIVVRVDSPSFCWSLVKGHDIPSNCSPVDHACTGARVSARFFPQHLWQRQSVKKLKKLALLTLAFAERENSLIGGDYEILSLTSAGFKLERFTNAEVKKWAATFLERLQSLVDTYEMNLDSTDVPL